jgi:methionyl aminopeptidase
LAKIPIKSAEQIEGVRQASQVTAKILDAVGELIKPGISTAEINDFSHSMTLAHGCTPATLNYKGFPASVCTSINDVVCHGIPSAYVTLNEGDIINVDITSIKDGYFGDASRMYFVGGREAATEEVQTLVDVTLKALNVGINAVKPGGNIGDIGAAIQSFIKGLPVKYGIVREYTGHGIGTAFHEPPQVIHVGRRGTGAEMRPGMIFTVEPMINLGTANTVLSKVDGWTVRTADGAFSAQWEHTVLVTDDGFEKLTQSLNGQDY